MIFAWLGLQNDAGLAAAKRGNHWQPPFVSICPHRLLRVVITVNWGS
jgi:hypothetical protein